MENTGKKKCIILRFYYPKRRSSINIRQVCTATVSIAHNYLLPEEHAWRCKEQLPRSRN